MGRGIITYRVTKDFKVPKEVVSEIAREALRYALKNGLVELSEISGESYSDVTNAASSIADMYVGAQR